MDLSTCVNFSVQIANVPFGEYPSLKDDTIGWIMKLFTEVDEQCTEHLLLRSRAYHPVAEMQVLNCHYGDYSQGSLNFWAYNNEEMMLYTYCEGDTTLSLYKTKEEYQKAYNEAYEFYKNY